MNEVAQHAESLTRELYGVRKANARLIELVESYEKTLREIATKTRYGCCNPIYPDSPECAHNIARRALGEDA